MKLLPFILISILFTGISLRSDAQPAMVSKESADVNEILQQTYSKLKDIKTLQYETFRYINYKSQDYENKLLGVVFVEFDEAIPIVGFRYQFDNEVSKVVFNDSGKFWIDKKNASMESLQAAALKKEKLQQDLNAASFFYNSILSLRNVIPHILTDTSIKKRLGDTLIDSRSYHKVLLEMKSKSFTVNEGLKQLTADIRIYNQILIDKVSYLPYQVVQSNNFEPEDYVLVKFDQIKINGPQIEENSWFASSYPGLQIKGKEDLQLIAAGANAPAFELEDFQTGKMVTMSDFKDDLVLLEFWVKNCSYCISAVPKMNSMVAKYEQKGLKVWGINSEDNKSQLNNFYERNKPTFSTLMDQDGKITKAYGVNGVPQVVLIHQGKVIYAGGIVDGKLDALIQKLLKK